MGSGCPDSPSPFVDRPNDGCMGGNEVAEVPKMTRVEGEALLEYLKKVPEERWDTPDEVHGG